MAGHRVMCGECGRVLDEPPDARPEDRPPCPDCGSMRRSVTVNLAGSVTATSSVVGDLTIGLPLLEPTTIYAPRVEQARKTLAEITATLRFIPPSSESPVWYCQTEDGGEVIDIGLADTFDDALLAAAEILSHRYRHLDMPDQPN